MIKKILLSISIIIALTAIGSFTTMKVYAATPTLSLVNISGASVQINVIGDPNSPVILYYNIGSSSGMQTTTLGNTNASGSFSTTITSYTYNISSGNSVYVVVNGQQSALQAWPYTSASSTPVLSQNSVTIGIGQSTTVYSQTGAVYMVSNSNSSVASASTNGTQITVTGNQIGSTTISICYTGTSSNCVNLTVNVQSTATSTLSLSQNSISLSPGSSQSITISGGSGIYNVSNNSNIGAASTNLSGNTLTVYASAVGNTIITICDQSGNCGTLYVTVSTTSTSGSLSFSQTNSYLTIGQITYVYISGGTNYYVSNNSNPNVASQTLSGSTLTISGLANGVSTITVCSTSNGCGSINITVGSSSSSSAVTFSTTNPIITLGQNINISLSGGSGYYISSNANSAIVQTSINGSTLTLYGAGVGSSSLTICISSGGCNTLYVTVANSTQTTFNNSAFLTQIQSLQNVVAQLLTQVQSVQNQLSQLASQLSSNTPSNTASTSNSTSYKFYNFIGVGSQGADVTALQQRLAHDGFYSGSITGYYGSLTEAAVKSYQKEHGITPAGYVGPSTRTVLNAEE